MSHGPLHKKNSSCLSFPAIEGGHRARAVRGWLCASACLRACSHGRAWSQNKAVVRFRSTHVCPTLQVSRDAHSQGP